jgi:hypothetical protein
MGYSKNVKNQTVNQTQNQNTSILSFHGEVEEGDDVMNKRTEKNNFLFFDNENAVFYLIAKSSIIKLQSQNKAPKEFKPLLEEYEVNFGSKSAEFEDEGVISYELFDVKSIKKQ